MRRRLWLLILSWIFACYSATSLAEARLCQPGNILANAVILNSPGVSHPERCIDSIATDEGAWWRTNRSAVFRSPSAFIVFDLGEPLPLRVGRLQGDNNDRYLIEGSNDATEWIALARVSPDGNPGMRTREFNFPRTDSRYVRLSVFDGDGKYSVSELALGCDLSGHRVERLPAEPIESALESFFWYWVGLIALLLAASTFNASKAITYSLIAALSLWTVWLIAQCAIAAPFDHTLAAFFRGATGLVAFFGLLVGALWTKQRKVVTSVLLASAAFSCSGYLHFFEPFFFNHGLERPTWVHTFDMRVYHPTAKYFPELGYDGLYLASLGAYLDIARERTTLPANLHSIKVRNLTDYTVSLANELEPEIDSVRQRFSSERWEEFVSDMTWFLGAMGRPDYLSTLTDHGANSPPSWMIVPHLLFSPFPVTENLLVTTGTIDLVLLLLLGVAIWRTFSLSTLAVSATLFGCLDFPNFGTNLVGSTLRYDWFVATGLAICALRARRYTTSGILLGASAMFRVFPAAFLVALPLHLLARVALRLKRKQRPLIAKSALVPYWRIAKGFGLTAVAFFLVSASFFPFETTWRPWTAKILEHANKPNINHVSLRSVVLYDSKTTAAKVFDRSHPEPWVLWQKHQNELLVERSPVLRLLQLFAGLFFALMVRAKPLYAALAGGVALFPILLYPANYYVHCTALLPLMLPLRADSASRVFKNTALFAAPLCLVAFFQYYTLQEEWAEIRYLQQSLLLMAALVAMGVIAWGRPKKKAV